MGKEHMTSQRMSVQEAIISDANPEISPLARKKKPLQIKVLLESPSVNPTRWVFKKLYRNFQGIPLTISASEKGWICKCNNQSPLLFLKTVQSRNIEKDNRYFQKRCTFVSQIRDNKIYIIYCMQEPCALISYVGVDSFSVVVPKLWGYLLCMS